MAKFCVKCGSPLNENGLCPNCDVTEETVEQQPEQKVSEKQEEPVNISLEKVTETEAVQSEPIQQGDSLQGDQQENPNMVQGQSKAPSQNEIINKIKTLLLEALAFFIAILKEPFTKSTDFIKSVKYPVVIIYIVIQGILTGVFALVSLSTFVNAVSGIFGSYYSVSLKEMGISRVEMFFVLFACSIALSFVLALILFVFAKIFKVENGKLQYLDMLAVVGAGKVLSIVLSVVTILVCLVDFSAGMFCFSFAALAYFVLIICVMPVHKEEDSNRKIYFLIVALVVYNLVVGISAQKISSYEMNKMMSNSYDYSYNYNYDLGF